MKLETINVEGPATGGAFDSHAHFGDDWRAVLLRAREAGMAGLVAVGCDARTNAFALAVAQAAPDFALLALGFDYSSGVTPEEAIANLVAPSPTCAAAPLWGCAPAPPPSERGVPRRGGGSIPGRAYGVFAERLGAKYSPLSLRDIPPLGGGQIAVLSFFSG